MQALHIHAGPKALAHIREHGLRPEHIGVIPGAAGGPKGLILGPLDRFIFGDWLSQSTQAVDLVGASIGAWRMATACLHDPVAAFERLERDYIAQHYELPPGQKRPSATQVSEQFGQNLHRFYGGRIPEVLEFFPRVKQRMHSAAASLSGGEQKQLEIGRALMANPAPSRSRASRVWRRVRVVSARGASGSLRR